MKSKHASILLYTLLILSLITILTQQLVKNVLVFGAFSTTIIAQDQARILAVSGVNLAISKLTKEKLKKSELSEPEKNIKEEELKKFLQKNLPYLNKWQTFNLNKEIDGVDGQIKICISCENGKININNAFDFEKQEFKEEVKLLLKGLYIKGKLAEGEILKRLTDFFKARKRKLDEISELMDIAGLEQLEVFYTPPKFTEKNIATPNINIFLQDLFTIWTEDEKIELLFFSDSVLAVFGMRRPLADDTIKFKDVFYEIAKTFKKDWGVDWEKNWKSLQPVYGPMPKILKKFDRIFSKEFGPNIYSVLSLGKIGDVEQQILAIIKEVGQDDKDKKEDKNKDLSKQEEKKNESEKEKTADKFFKIVKVYWL